MEQAISGSRNGTVAVLGTITPASGDNDGAKRIGLAIAGLEQMGMRDPIERPCAEQLRCAWYLRKRRFFGRIGRAEQKASGAQRGQDRIAHCHPARSLGMVVRQKLGVKANERGNQRIV